MSHLALITGTPPDDAFRLALEREDLDTMRRILASDAVSKEKIQDGFDEACNMGNPEMVQLMIDHGADVNARGTSDGCTAIMQLPQGLFSEEVGLTLLKILLRSGADIHAEDEQGCSVMDHEIEHHRGSPEFFKLLMEYGAANIRSTYQGERSFMDMACLKPAPFAAIALIDCGFEDFKKYEARLVFNLRLHHPAVARTYVGYDWDQRERFKMFCILVENGTSLDTPLPFPESVVTARSRYRDSRERMSLLLGAEARFKAWERRKDLLGTLVNASHTYLGADHEISIPYGPLRGKEAEDSAIATPASTLATVLRDTRMLGHEKHRYVAEYGGMTAMFL